MITRRHALQTFSMALMPAHAAPKPAGPRQTISLDGVWQIEQGGMDAPPTAFTHSVPVPGLVDLASPGFTDVGKVSKQRQAFWYRRNFRVEKSIPEIALLKLHKSRYGVTVWLNGKLLGQHMPCFTPVEFDARALLKTGDNEVMIRIGANREAIPTDQPSGWDFEKYKFTPGLYDSVELILSGAPYIRNVQVVPDPIAKSVRVVAEILGGARPARFRLNAEAAGKSVSSSVRLAANEQKKVDFVIPLRDGHLWTPEDPFLYELRLNTGADAVRVRFGLRSFRFDPVTKRALLNERPYFLRGSNITIDRFYEDDERAALPWDAAWVRKLHQQIKAMNWNSLRYCIGFPPDFWYDIADEVGVLIQDEFPIWLLSGKNSGSSPCPEFPVAEKIIPEYTAWMRERWNHPCVVIWDAQNESITAETGKARDAVRHFDLSNRPWDNGWGLPGLPTDVLESHPYLFSRAWGGGKPEGGKPFFLRELSTTRTKPALRPEQNKLEGPIIINEYCWLWIDRTGKPTCLTEKVYESLIGANATVDQRRRTHARCVAALTEFWRCHRQTAGVLHFCSLGYSRDGSKPRPEGGATSDDWIDLRALRYEPYFAEYVKEAFAPAGLMLDFWADTLIAGEQREMPVVVINDLGAEWRGELRLRLLRGTEVISEKVQPCSIAPFGARRQSFEFTAPVAGVYTLEAALIRHDAPPTRSLRDFRVG